MDLHVLKMSLAALFCTFWILKIIYYYAMHPHPQSKHNEFGPFIHTWHWYAHAHVFSLVLKHDFVFLCFGFCYWLRAGSVLQCSRLNVLQLHCFCSLLLVLPCMRLWLLSDAFIMDWTIVQWWFYAPLPFRKLLLWISFQQNCMCWTFCIKETNHQRKRVNASHEHSKDVTQTQQRCHMNESVKSMSLVFVGYWVSEEECSVWDRVQTCSSLER